MGGDKKANLVEQFKYKSKGQLLMIALSYVV